MSKDWILITDRLPKERKRVIVLFDEVEERGLPQCEVIGYLRYSAGDKDYPYFVTPGYLRESDPIAWAEFEGPDFYRVEEGTGD